MEDNIWRMERVLFFSFFSFFFFKNCGYKIADDGVDFEVSWLYNEVISDV